MADLAAEDALRVSDPHKIMKAFRTKMSKKGLRGKVLKDKPDPCLWENIIGDWQERELLQKLRAYLLH